jgi:hypothetical protein
LNEFPFQPFSAKSVNDQANSNNTPQRLPQVPSGVISEVLSAKSVVQPLQLGRLSRLSLR